ncbi:TRAP transporter substrate-binding protein DctP [uncultured Desulfovibrio sp.]|uniref:TRAP transporter substrate-binding protein DctP n=1 Tax=uncultured Desulfovibrio sp. TaxID=167968 RepID=UPI0028054212|nr:TRAP transporter substrate-binding protein DctP [uncultured Desulfovibrio sp.]
MFRRSCVLLLVLAFAFGLFCASGASAARVWKLGHTLPKGTPEDVAIQDFAARVGELSGGAIRIKVFPAMQLGDWTVMQQRVSMGGLEMATQPASSQADKRISFLYFPYLFKNVEMLRKNFAKDAAFRKDLDALFLGQNIYPIAYVPLFFGGVATKEMPRQWNVPGAPKGVKLRVPNDPAFALHAETMGYQPTPIPMSDTFTALQTGIVDGVLGFGAVGVYGNYRDLVKYYIPLNDFIQLWPVMINLQLWQSLSEEQKALLTRAADELEARRYADFAAIEADYRAKLQGAGVKVVEVSPEVIDAFAAAAREKCWPALAEKIDAAWINRALKAIVE